MIDRRAARRDGTIDRNSLSRPDDHEFADGDVAGGNLDLDPVPPNPSRARGLIDERSYSPLGPGERDGLEHLADQGNEDHLRGDERLSQHERRDARLRQREIGPDPPVQECLEGAVDDVHSAQNRRDQASEMPAGSRQSERPAMPSRTSPPIKQPQHRREDVKPARLRGPCVPTSPAQTGPRRADACPEVGTRDASAGASMARAE